jgi:hypothetical protein
MRPLLAGALLVIAALAQATRAAISAQHSAGPPAALPAILAAQSSKTGAPTPRPAQPPLAAIKTPTAATLPKSRAATAPVGLGGPAKYDPKKNAMLGGTVMPPHTR